MPTYLEYTISDGVTVLVEAPDVPARPGGLTLAAGGAEATAIHKAQQSFSDALAGVTAQAQALKAKLEELRADEVEVTFGLKTAGELGNFAVGKVGVEANYTVTLKWANSGQSPAKKRAAALRAKSRRG